MKTTKPQSDAAAESQQLSAVGSTAQPSSNDGFDKDAVLEIMQSLNLGESVNVIEAEKKGLIVARIEGFNRDVNKKHVYTLIDSVKKIGGFLQPIKVLNAGIYFTFYPDRKLVANGAVIDKDSPECYRVVINLDGQHRYEAEKALAKEGNHKPSLQVECIDLHGLTPDRWMTEINTLQRNWTSKDRTNHILSITDNPDTNIYLVREWQNKYGMGERAAYAILRLDDNYKKSWHTDCMNMATPELPIELRGTPQQRVRGAKILHAFEVGFRNHPRMLKNMAAINLAIEKYILADDADKELMVKQIILFFTSLDKGIADKSAAESGVAGKKNILSQEWDRISKKFTSESSYKALEEQAAASEAEWQTIQTSRQSQQQKKQTRKAKS